MRSLLCLTFALSIPTAAVAQGAEPFRYPPGVHKTGQFQGELKYIDGIPVLILEGTAAQMGEQTGELALKHAKPLLDFPRDYFRSECANEIRRLDPKLTEAEVQFAVGFAEPKMWAKFQKIAAELKPNFPKEHSAELDALIKAAGVDAQHLISTNGMFDLGHISPGQLRAGCSSLVIPPQHSATKGLLFGRNLDFFHFGYLHRYSLLMVYRSNDPKKKHSFVSAGFPGLVGSFTGMNDAGLTLASHDVLEPNTTTRFNPKGVPFGMAYRRILEECATVGDALKLLDSLERASVTSLVIADAEGGAVIEVTSDTLAVRRFKDKPGVCTNHFRVLNNPKQTDSFKTLDRFDTLTKSVAVKKDEGFGIADIRKRLHAARLFDANGDDLTIQTFVFEPAKRTVHLRFGDGPATKGKLATLELNTLWGK